MIGADLLLKSLEQENVNTIFGYPGGATIPLHDKMKDYPHIRHIMPRHEQGGALAADGYYRATGKVGVCLSTSGPGATNLVTGIANAFLDSVGMVAITCQVHKDMVGSDAFQEVDITGITQPITKHNYFVEDAEDLPRIIKEAFYLASTGRPGPVHIDIPVNLFKQEVNEFVYPNSVDLPGYHPPAEADLSQIERAVSLIEKSERPVILFGHGVIISGASEELRTFIEKAEIPAMSTLLGLGGINEKHPLYFGMLGMHGMAYANYAVHNADLIIGIGMRFDDRITGKIDEFAKQADVIHIDVDAAEIGKNTIVDVPLLGDCKKVLSQINAKLSPQSHADWVSKIKEWNDETGLEKIKSNSRLQESDHLMAQSIIQEICMQAGEEVIISSDVGQNQMWTAQYFDYSRPHQLLSSGGLGAMGYSLPAAIGAQFGCPEKSVWSLMGDGGFQMNMQELGTIMEHKLPIKIVIFQNGYLGMVRQWQELFYDKNYASTKLVNPDFCKIAQAYGIESHRITTSEEAKKIIAQVKDYDKPVLLEFMIGPEDNVLPMVPPGNNLGETITKSN